jgi:uncharacterized SAM-binding protein YcdF (DUF218 family)
MFLVKKFISQFLMPFPIFLILIGIGIYFRHRGNSKIANRTFFAALIWISLLSYPPFSNILLKPLENTYPKIDMNAPLPTYIHVLGSGHTSNRNLPLSSELGSTSLIRVNEGVAIYKSHPNMKLIFSGYGGDDPISNAQMNRDMAIVLGVDPNDIIVLEAPKDTREEAIAAKNIVGNKPLVLVTSASHMVRASALFRKNGVTVIEAPTDFQVKQEDSLWQFPSAGGLSRSESAFHEYIGLIWSKLKGFI